MKRFEDLIQAVEPLSYVYPTSQSHSQELVSGIGPSPSQILPKNAPVVGLTPPGAVHTKWFEAFGGAGMNHFVLLVVQVIPVHVRLVHTGLVSVVSPPYGSPVIRAPLIVKFFHRLSSVAPPMKLEVRGSFEMANFFASPVNPIFALLLSTFMKLLQAERSITVWFGA
jgi:hypothetical protein